MRFHYRRKTLLHALSLMVLTIPGARPLPKQENPIRIQVMEELMAMIRMQVRNCLEAESQIHVSGNRVVMTAWRASGLHDDQADQPLISAERMTERRTSRGFNFDNRIEFDLQSACEPGIDFEGPPPTLRLTTKRIDFSMSLIVELEKGPNSAGRWDEDAHRR